MLVKAFKKAGHIVAVTGDGVNDAPAIKAADIGISMGIEGTDVSKEASDMILQDDNFTAIVSAIGEGRVVFDNLVKVIRYLVSCNMSEIMIILLSVLMGYPLPLLPIHLLWINLVTGGFPSLALGMEPGEKDIMKRKPRKLSEGILTPHRWMFIILEGAIMGTVAFVAFRISYAHYGIDVARTVTFLTLNCAQLIHALNTRSEKKSLFQMNIWGNKLLLTVFVISIMVHSPPGLTLSVNWPRTRAWTSAMLT
jgi:Ca2+-transporting ATPase